MFYLYKLKFSWVSCVSENTHRSQFKICCCFMSKTCFHFHLLLGTCVHRQNTLKNHTVYGSTWETGCQVGYFGVFQILFKHAVNSQHGCMQFLSRAKIPGWLSASCWMLFMNLNNETGVLLCGCHLKCLICNLSNSGFLIHVCDPWYQQSFWHWGKSIFWKLWKERLIFFSVLF